MNTDTNTLDIKGIIYDEQFKIKLFFPILILTKVGFGALVALTYYFGPSIDVVALMIVVLYAYSKYENIKRNELHTLFLVKYFTAFINKAKA